MADLTSKLLLVLAGAIAGLLSGTVGAYFKAYLDRRSELEKADAAVRLQFLYPLLAISTEFREKLASAFEKVKRENDIKTPVEKMTEDYYLRHWFWRCKEYVVNSEQGSTQESRRRDIAMHSGGSGNESLSTLYVTAAYLWYATRIRLQMPSELQGRGIELSERLHSVRDSLAGLQFYPVSQDSTGASVTNRNGDVMNYREFCEALTGDAERAWFLTLTDVYFKLHDRDQMEIDRVTLSLDGLIDLLREMLMFRKSEMTSRVSTGLIQKGIA
jgi:hypothetical protein